MPPLGAPAPVASHNRLDAHPQLTLHTRVRPQRFALNPVHGRPETASSACHAADGPPAADPPPLSVHRGEGDAASRCRHDAPEGALVRCKRLLLPVRHQCLGCWLRTCSMTCLQAIHLALLFSVSSIW